MAGIILFKADDIPKFVVGGKYATCRKIGWNQVAKGKKAQFRINFQLPPFAFADVSEKKEVYLGDLDSFASLGCKNLDDYLKTYGDCPNGDNLWRTYIEFNNIEFNWEFPFEDYPIEFDGRELVKFQFCRIPFPKMDEIINNFKNGGI